MPGFDGVALSNSCGAGHHTSTFASSDKSMKGLFWELSPGPLAPEARIMPLDQTAIELAANTIGKMHAAHPSTGNVKAASEFHSMQSGHPESNQGPSDGCMDLQSDALPTEL
jgi:hypothetical protein